MVGECLQDGFIAKPQRNQTPQSPRPAIQGRQKPNQFLSRRAVLRRSRNFQKGPQRQTHHHAISALF